MIETLRRCKALWLLFPVAAFGLLPQSAGAEPNPQRTPVPTPLYGAYLAGIEAQTLHNYKAANAWLSKAWRADPNDPELTARAFVAALADGKFAEARTLAARELKTPPGSALAQLVLLVEDLKAGKAAAALAAAQSLPQSGIHRFLRPLALAWTRAGTKDFDGAQAAFDVFNPFPDLALLRHFQAGLVDDFAGHPQKAEANFRSALKATGRLNWRLTYLIGNFYLRHGRNKEAQALYRRFRKEHPESDLARLLPAHPPAKKPPPIVASAADGFAEGLFDLASILNAPESRDLALIYTRLALALAPKNGGAQLLLADILSAEGHPRRSLAVLARIPPASPYSWPARLRLAADLDAAGEKEKAIALLDRMAQAEPSWSGALVEEGDLLQAAKRYPQAVKAYEGAIRRLKASRIAVSWSLDYGLGVALDRSGHWKEAERALLRALKKKPDDPFILNYLGYSWVNRGQHVHRGLKLLEKAVALRPSDGYIIDSLGWAHYRLGQYAAAVRYLQKATELVPDDPTINDHLGDAYWRAGRPREARFQWSQALQFGPKKSRIKTIEAKLQRGLGPAGGG